MNPDAYRPNVDKLVAVQNRLIVLFLTLAIIGGWIAIKRWQSHRTPEHALEQIREIKSEADIKDHEDYLTARGRKILAIAVPVANDFGVHPSFGTPTVDGDAIIVPFTDPKADGRLEFKQNGGWQLDNIILTTLNKRRFYADLSSVADPMYALFKAFADKSPGQVMADSRYLTDKGKKVRLQMLKQNEGSNHRDDNGALDEPVVDGDTARFALHVSTSEGEVEGYYQVVNAYDGWRFDDLIIVKVNGRTINQSLAEKIDNPLWVWFKSAFW